MENAYEKKDYLKCYILCKRYNQNGDYIGNFSIGTRYTRTVKIPALFIAANSRRPDVELILSRVPYQCVKKASDHTNQQPITLLEFFLTNREDCELFATLKGCMFDVCDGNVNAFFTQQRISIGEECYCLSSIRKRQVAGSTERLPVYEYTPDENWPSRPSTHPEVVAYTEACVSFFEKIKCGDLNIRPKQVMYTFDIETGVKNKADHRAPTVFGGFVECICALSVICGAEGYDLETRRLDIYCTRYEGFGVYELTGRINEKLKQHALTANVIVFENETAMILAFLREVYWHCDYIIGYNSDSYDWTFLVNRYKVLKEGFHTVIDPQKRWSRGVIDLVNLPSKIYGISCSTNVVFPATCCGKASPQTSEGYLCSKCKQLIVPSELNLSCQLDMARFTRSIMPFTLHYDIYKNAALTGTLQNKQLNTLVGQTFSLEILEYEPLSEVDTFLCRIKAVVGMKCLFMPNLVCHLVRMNKTTKIPQTLFDGKIVSLEGDKIVVKITRKLCLLTDLGGLSITIGKTSSISSETQMRWTCVEDMIDTVAYCCVDVLLTFFVEYYTKRLVNLPTQIFNALPYALLNKTTATLACNLLLYELYEKSLSLSIDAGNDTSILLYDALRLEGVRATGVDVSGGVLRVAAAKTIDEYFSSNNHNESRLGMNAEPDLSTHSAALTAVGAICQ